MKKIISFIIIMLIVLSAINTQVFAEEEPFRYFQDFSASSVPKDSVFEVTEYTNIEDGTIKQKIKNSRGGYNLTLPEPMTDVWYEARAMFMFSISLELELVSSKGDSKKIRMVPNDGKIYDTGNNVIGTIEAASPSKWRTVGVLVRGNTAYLYLDKELISHMSYDLDDLSVFKFIWVNETASDLRPKSDDILITADKSEFPTLPEIYTEEPTVISTTPTNGAEKVAVTNGTIVIEFKNPIDSKSVSDEGISVICGDVEVHNTEYSLSEDLKKLSIKIADELEPETEYKITVSGIESEYSVKMSDPIIIVFKTDDGVFEITDIVFTETDGIIKAAAAAANKKKSDINASIIMCLCKGTYDSYYVGSLKEVSVTVKSGVSETLAVEWNEDLAEGEFLKVFFWESSDAMQPFCESVVCK